MSWDYSTPNVCALRELIQSSQLKSFSSTSWGSSWKQPGCLFSLRWAEAPEHHSSLDLGMDFHSACSYPIFSLVFVPTLHFSSEESRKDFSPHQIDSKTYTKNKSCYNNEGSSDPVLLLTFGIQLCGPLRTVWCNWAHPAHLHIV